MRTAFFLCLTLLTMACKAGETTVAKAQALPWYPDEFDEGRREFGELGKIKARRLLSVRKVKIGVRKVRFDRPASIAVLDGGEKDLLVVESGSAVLRRYDLGTGDVKGVPIPLRETPSHFFTSGPWWMLVNAASGRVELRHESAPDLPVSWSVPGDERLVAIGIAASEPGAPLLLVTADRSKRDLNNPGASLRLHALETHQLTPSKWKPEDDADFARGMAYFERFPSERTVVPLDVSADGRSVVVPGARWTFNARGKIGTEAFGVPAKWIPGTKGSLALRHGRWVVAEKNGGIAGPEGPGLQPFPALENHWVTSSNEVLVAGGFENGGPEGLQPLVALVDAATLSPLAVISGIGAFEDERLMPVDLQFRTRWFHAAGSGKLVVLSAVEEGMVVVDLPVEQLRRELPHRKQPAYVAIPSSGQIKVPLPDDAAFKGCQWELVDPPEGARLTEGSLVWQKPPNLELTHRPVRFEIDAVFPDTQRVRVSVLGFRPRPDDKS